MKKIILLLSCIFVMTSMSAQTSFQELTLEKALEQAKVENKYVFIDCYTSWCGPCKMMAEKILPLKEVGEYMNGKFVCVKFNMEKGEGRAIQQKYRVSAYPTFLNRNMDFLLKYIKALVKSCDLEKAQKIAQDVVVALDDVEKCSEPYWFIYANRDLSPVGSGNMVYLLKHMEQFRKVLGEKRLIPLLQICLPSN